MKCTRCKKNMTDEKFVYQVNGLNGYYCLNCAIALKALLGFSYARVSNIPYYTD